MDDVKGFLARLFSQPLTEQKPEVQVKLIGVESLPPERVAELEAHVTNVRMNGRPVGSYLKVIKQELLEAGHGAPTVIEDSATGTTTVPATFEGLVSHVASWDSLLLDEELAALRVIVKQMVPAGLNQQHQTRLERAEEAADLKHLQEAHPDEWERLQGHDA